MKKQQNRLSKEDTSYPTVSNEVLVLSCMIYSMEGRYVATTNIPGSFIQTYYDKGDTHIKMEGVMVTILKVIG